MLNRETFIDKTVFKNSRLQNISNKKNIYLKKWLSRTELQLKLLIFDNFYLVIYFLFFIFLNQKNKKQYYNLLKLFLSLKANKFLEALKRLSFITNFLSFKSLHNFLLLKITKQWNTFLLKNFSKRFLTLIQFNLGTSSRSLFLIYLKKILNFFFTHKAEKLLSFMSFALNSWLHKVAKLFIFKENFFFSIENRYAFFFPGFYWQFSNKARYFFSHMLLWIYFIFDKMTLVHWLAFFFFWLRNFVFLLFGLNWLWINGKDDIFKAFEYSRNITIFFNNNLFLRSFHSLDYDTAFFKLFNKVKGISSNLNFVYYKKNTLEDWDVFSSFYFFQDKSLNFYLKMQQDVLSFNAFVDRYLNQSVKNSLGASSEFFPYFLDFQMIKPNMKNFWFLDSFQNERTHLFLNKNMESPYFYLKINKSLHVSSTDFLEAYFFPEASPFLGEPRAIPLPSKIFFYLKRFFLERFFLFFLDKFFFFSYFFFQHFFIYNFFFKFVKFLSICFWNFLNFFFFKVHSAKPRIIFVYFCLFLKFFFRQQQFATLGYGFFFDLLKINSWNIALTSNSSSSISRSNFFLLTLLKSFSFFPKKIIKRFNFNSSLFFRKIFKKILFWEFFLKKSFFFYLKKKSKFSHFSKLPVFHSLSSLRLKRLRSLFFFFLTLEESMVFRRKATKTLADFSMENFLSSDFFYLSSFFFKSFSSFSKTYLPFIFWNHYKLNIVRFSQAKIFSYLQKLCFKALKTFMHFFFFFQKHLLNKYLEFFKKVSYNFLKIVLLLKQTKPRLLFKPKFSNYFTPSFSTFSSVFFSGSVSQQSKNFFFTLLSSLKTPSFFLNRLSKDGKNLFSMDSLAHSFPFFNAPSYFINDFQVQMFFTKKFFLTKGSFIKFLKKTHSFQGNFFFKQCYNVNFSSFFFSFSDFFLKKNLAQSFAPQKINFFKHLSFSKVFNKNKNFYFFSGSKSLNSHKSLKIFRLINALKRKKSLLTQYFFRQKKSYRRSFLAHCTFTFLYKSNVFSKSVQIQKLSPFLYFTRNFFNYKNYNLFFNSFFLQNLNTKYLNFFFSFRAILRLNKIVSKNTFSKTFFVYDYKFFQIFFSKFFFSKNLNLFLVSFAKVSPIRYIMPFFFKAFLNKVFFLRGPFRFSAMPFFNFIISSFPFFKNISTFFSPLHFFYLLKNFFLVDYFVLNRSFFYLDFFSAPFFSHDLFFFNFFSVNFSFLVAPSKKNSQKKIKGLPKGKSWRIFPFVNFNCFIFKSKGFVFFLRKYEVLLFLDNVYIWLFCFRDRIIKKLLIFGSSRVFFFKPFFFAEAFKKSFSFLQLLKSIPQWTVVAKDFNFLYNKRLIKQKSLLLSFYFFNNTLVLFLDKFFWSLVSFKQLSFFFKTTLQANPFQFFFFKKNCFFVPFFFKETNIQFFFSMPSFIQKISWKTSINFLQPRQGSFLAFDHFFFFNYSKPFLKKKVLTSDFSLQFFNKRLVFLNKILNPFLNKSFIFLKWLRFYRSLKFSDLSPFKWRHFYLFQDWKSQIHNSWGAKFFVPSKNRKLLVLESKPSAKLKDFHSFRMAPYTFFLHYFYNYKFYLHKHNLIFFRYFNNFLQKFDLQLQRDFFSSFLRFFWKDGRKFWYIKLSNAFYVWDFVRKTWFLFKKFSAVRFYFPLRVLSLQPSIYLSRVHFKIFNSSAFNQFFSFSFIKRWTSWKFLYRMHDFLAQLSIQRKFIKRGLSLNYRGITLSNSFFGTTFSLNNRSFYSFNNLLLRTLLYNVKSIFFYNIHTIFSMSAFTNFITHKTFFSFYAFFPFFSKSIFNVFTHFKSFSQSLFFFSNFSFFVKSSVQGFFWNYLSFINPFIKMKKYSLAFKAKFFDSHFCNFLFLDFKDRTFYSRFYGARLNYLWRKVRS